MSDLLPKSYSIKIVEQDEMNKQSSNRDEQEMRGIK